MSQKLILSESTNEGAFSSKHCGYFMVFEELYLVDEPEVSFLLVTTSFDVQ